MSTASNGWAVPLRRPAQVEKPPPCRLGCPIGVDVRGWVALIAQREKLGLSLEEAYRRAWAAIVDRNPFPATTGRICPHPCETDCNRKDGDGAVAINALERFVGDWALAAGLELPKASGRPQPESIGVVGAGPAGLSFAYQLARRGYHVTVYEREQQAGGTLRYAIPAYRLPNAVLDGEVARIADLGVELRCGTAVGDDVTLEQLHAQHEVVFLAVGAQKGRSLGIPGEDGSGTWTGMDFLRRLNGGERLSTGRRVAVIGGGNTAIDAARSARRVGADVTIVYRRTRDEMPAIEAEVEEALCEDVQIEVRVAPVALERNGDGSPSMLVLQRMRLGEPDASGRPRAVPVEGSEFALPVDSIVAAVSQEPDLATLGLAPLAADESGAVASGLWAGGDVLAAGIAAEAIAAGARAAELVHAQLRGVDPARSDGDGTAAVALVDSYVPRARASFSQTPVAERLARSDLEVTATLAEDEFLAEVDRCLSCGSCFGCERCSMYCNTLSFTRAADPAPGSYFALTLELCEGCGKCVELCPCRFLSLAG